MAHAQSSNVRNSTGLGRLYSRQVQLTDPAGRKLPKSLSEFDTLVFMSRTWVTKVLQLQSGGDESATDSEELYCGIVSNIFFGAGLVQGRTRVRKWQPRSTGSEALGGDHTERSHPNNLRHFLSRSEPGRSRALKASQTLRRQ